MIMRLKILFLFFLSSFLLFSCKKKSVDIGKESNIESSLKEKYYYGVVTEDRLRLRLLNDLRAKTLRYLNKGDIVLILGKDENVSKIGELEGYWYHVEYRGIRGWVFGYYLEIYPTFEEAKNSSKRYTQQQEEKTDFIEAEARNNLFYLSNGKLYQNISGKPDNSIELQTISQKVITFYFYAPRIRRIFYIAKNNIFEKNGEFYSYDLEKKENVLIKRNIHFGEYEIKLNIFVAISYPESKRLYWTISFIYLSEPFNVKEIARIEATKELPEIEKDTFTKTVIREKGSLCYLKVDEEGSLIYFKPPQEELYYLISTYDGKYIKINKEEKNIYYLDSSRNIIVKSKFDENTKKPKYSIVILDKFSDTEKEIFESSLYPLNFSISKDPNIIAISMINLEKQYLDFYESNIYILHIPTGLFYPITSNNSSYQAKWIYF